MIKALFAIFYTVYLAVYWPLRIIRFTLRFLWTLGEEVSKAIATKSEAKGAEWATYNALKRGGYVGPGGFRIGLLDGKPVHTGREDSLIMFGVRGAGKSQSCGSAIRNKDDCHLVIQDAKGELFRRHADFLKAKGFKVRCVNIQNPVGCDTYDPLSFFDASTELSYARDVKLFCQLIVQADKEGREAPHFYKNTRRFVGGAIIAGVRYDDEVNSLYEIARNLNAQETRHARSTYFDRLKLYRDPIVTAAVNTFQDVGEREQGSFISTMGEKMEPWLDPSIRAACEDGQWTWEDTFTGPKSATFLVTGNDHLEVIEPYVRLFIGLAAASISRRYGRVGRPVRRQGFWDNRRRELTEALVHQVCHIRPLHLDEASGAV